MNRMSYARRFERFPELTIPVVDALISGRGGAVISFAGGSPHTADLPISELSGAIGQVMREQGARALAYGSSDGEEPLREELPRLIEREGIDAQPERLIVTSGALHALDLTFRLLLDPGDLVVVEAPSYSDALASLATYEVQIAALPMDSDGAIVSALPDLVTEAGKEPKLIYTMPTFHNPVGVSLSHERRVQLLELAGRYGAAVVEDDPYSAFRFRGAPLPALAALDSSVIAVRSLSKIVAPGLRLGYLVAPVEIVAGINRLRAATDICSGVFAQHVAACFLSAGALDNHIDRVCGLFLERRDVMIGALEKHFGEMGATWTDPDGGIFIWMDFADGTDTQALLPLAVDEGVGFMPGHVFAPAGGFQSSLRLSFAGCEAEEIADGVGRLRSAYDRLQQGESGN